MPTTSPRWWCRGASSSFRTFASSRSGGDGYPWRISPNDDTTLYTCDLCALLEDGRQVQLVRKLRSKAEAQYLEAALERRLSIGDRRVVGESTK
jgi:hypothetical protein